MRKIFLGLFLTFLLSLPLMAQDYSKVDVFGGYQFLHLGGQDGIDSINASGWDASATLKAYKNLGIGGDFSGSYKSINGASGHVYTYTFGPTYSLKPSGKAAPFIHALFGGTSVGGSVSGGGSGGTSGFAMFVGGGVDAKVKSNFSIRVVQFDWLHYSVNGVSGSNNVRICGGVVFYPFEGSGK